MADVTRLIEAARAGDRNAAADLLPLVYDGLRKLAAVRMAGEAPGHTLQPTGLVHEAYLRLVGPADDARWDEPRALLAPPPRPCAASSSITPAARSVRNTAAADNARTSTRTPWPPR